MKKNSSLTSAKKSKNDEFYTVYEFIQREVNAYLEVNPGIFRDKVILLPCDDPEWSNFTKFFAENFEVFGIKKLISTSYSIETKEKAEDYQFTLFEMNAPQFDQKKSLTRGKIFTLSRDSNKSTKINIDDLKWSYLEGDGDFRSDEVKVLRDKADIIITNPPFSLFREFMAWVFESEKDLLIVGSQNAITYKEVFPLIKANKLWLGSTCNNADMVFSVPEGTEIKPSDKNKAEKMGYVGNFTRLGNASWFTNLDHGARHQPIPLMSLADNLKFSNRRVIIENGYSEYLNYPNCIEVPFVNAIPSDYDDLMGVPITFIAQYCPEQFEIVGSIDADVLPKDWRGITQSFVDLYYKQGKTGAIREGNRLACYIDNTGNAVVPYKRILIKRRK